MSLLDKSVVLLPPYATKSIYTVVKEFEHKGTAKVRLRHPETGSEHAKYASEVRIANDNELAASHRIEPHEVFQEWFKTQPFYGDLLNKFGDTLFDFERSDQTYQRLHVNMTWITWQEKEKQLEGHRWTIGAQAEVISKQEAALKGVETLIDEWKGNHYCVTRTLDQFATDIQNAMQGGAQ